MGFAEGIAAKAHHHVPDLCGFVGRHAALLRTAVKAVFKIPQLVLAIFFGQHFTQRIGFGMRKAGQSHRSARNIFLIHHDAEGLSEHFGQKRMNRVPAAAVQATDIFLDEFIGCRADDTAVNDQVFEIADFGFLLQKTHGRAFNIEAAHGATLGQSLLGGKIVFGLPAQLVEGGAVVAQVGQGVANDPEAAATALVM
mgnify:CR=1 FL=1